MTEARAAQIVKDTLYQVFGQFVTKDMIERSVWEGDPYEWSPGALATISMEDGLPDNTYSIKGMELWGKVNEHLGAHGIFIEPVNGGMSAVHQA